MKKTIIKIAAIIILVGIIIGISVIKSSISAKREAERLTSIKEEYFKSHDSLLLAQFDDSTRIYIDSILKLEEFYQSQIDSLNLFYAIEDSLRLIEKAEEVEKTEKAEKAKSKIVAQKPAKTDKPEMKKSIDTNLIKLKSNFDSLLYGLPGDLTKYEKEVSVRELVIELSNKYKISPDSVKKILGKSL
jgi:hypothetical protein